jgi:hypothetical protein
VLSIGKSWNRDLASRSAYTACRRPSIYQRKDLNDLWANGLEGGCLLSLCSAVSLILPPRMFGVWAQKAQMYTGGRLLRSMLTHCPWSQLSHDSLFQIVSQGEIKVSNEAVKHTIES